MESFRHNLTPVEIKIFLKTLTHLTADLFIRYCYKTAAPCPSCGRPELCKSGAISVFSSSFDKLTHEVAVCLHCGYIDVTTLLTCERL